LEEIDHHVRCIKQPVAIVAMNVKCHLSQDRTSQYIVMIASRTINQNEVTAVEADLVETVVVEDLVETVVVEDLVIEDHVRCIKQPVAIVAMNVKFLSNQVEKNQFTVMIAFLTTD
jgi:hypothetical protein